MNEIFQRAAAYTPPRASKIRAVGIGEFAISTRNSEENLLYTRFANVCAGLALVAEDNSVAALLHVLSDRDYYQDGQDHVEAQVERQWNSFVEKLQPKTEFLAVAFGGHNFKNAEEMIVPARPEYQITNQKAVFVSRWIGNALFDKALRSGFIAEIDDVRFQGPPHDAAVNRATGEIIVDNKRDRLAGKMKGHYFVGVGSKLPAYEAPAMELAQA